MSVNRLKLKTRSLVDFTVVVGSIVVAVYVMGTLEQLQRSERQLVELERVGLKMPLR